ncbi:MAG: ShlB/FhaC/HecB family hemolysin secretion/activation protein [Pseudomonas sp.]
MTFALKPTALLTATTALLASPVWAQVTAPDAGRLLQQQQIAPELPVQRSIELQQVPQLLNKFAPGGASVLITDITFVDNSRLSREQLLAALPPEALTQPLDLSGIQSLADAFSGIYRNAGYPFARVFVPAQKMKNGALTLQVVEGRYDQVTAKGEAATAARAQGYLDAGLPSGAVIETAALERTMLLIADLPNMSTAPLMQPGDKQGTGNLVLNVDAPRRVSGEVGVDNHGNRYSGAYRTRASVQVDNPFIVGDQLQLSASVSDEKTWLGSAAYSLPVGNSGLRSNTSVAHTYYELGKEFASSQSNGTADVLSSGLTYPLIRSQQFNLNLSTQWQYKRLNDRQDAVNSDTQKHSNSVPVTASFDVRDQVLGSSAVTFGSLTYTRGKLILDRTLRSTDATTAQTAGHFGKLNLDVARLQGLPADFSLYTKASAQWSPAGKNLDSSEGFGLGGPTGVRAYPVGEGYGDAGWMTQIELRYSLGSVAPYAFYDTGSVKIKSNPWDNATNSRTLAGAGVGVRYQYDALSIDTAAAWRTAGGAPQSDSRNTTPTVWANVGYKF